MIWRKVHKKSNTRTLPPGLCSHKWRFLGHQSDPFYKPKSRNLKKASSIIYPYLSNVVDAAAAIEQFNNEYEEWTEDTKEENASEEILKIRQEKGMVNDLVRAAYSRLVVNSTFVAHNAVPARKETFRPDDESEPKAKDLLSLEAPLTKEFGKKAASRGTVMPVDETYQTLIQKNRNDYNTAKSQLQAKLESTLPLSNSGKMPNRLAKKSRENEEEMQFTLPPIEKLNETAGRYAMMVKRERFNKELPILKPIINYDGRSGGTKVGGTARPTGQKRGKKNRGSKFSLVQRLADETERGQMCQKEEGKAYTDPKLTEFFKGIKDLLDGKQEM